MGCLLLFTAASAIFAVARAAKYHHLAAVLAGAVTLVLFNLAFLRTMFAANCKVLETPLAASPVMISCKLVWCLSATMMCFSLTTLSLTSGSEYDLLWVCVAMATIAAFLCPIVTWCTWIDQKASRVANWAASWR